MPPIAASKARCWQPSGCFRSDTEDLKPLPIVRVKVPGNRILVDGLLLQFDSLFAKDNPNLQVFRGKRHRLHRPHFRRKPARRTTSSISSQSTRSPNSPASIPLSPSVRGAIRR